MCWALIHYINNGISQDLPVYCSGRKNYRDMIYYDFEVGICEEESWQRLHFVFGDEASLGQP